MIRQLQLKIGGIKYSAEVEIEEGYVACVYSVEVYDGCNYFEIDMTEEDKQEFFNQYEDYLNEEYEEYLAAQDEIAGEEKWERETGR